MDLDKLEKLCRKATPGPWDTVKRKDNRNYIGSPKKPIADICNLYGEESESNMQFIIEARTALPELIARVREAEAKCEQLRKELDRANESSGKIDAELYRITIEKEQAEADCAAILAELKHTQICLGNIDCRADTDALIEQIDEYFEKDNPGTALLAELEGLRKVRDAAEKLMKNICSYCPSWKQEDISICAKWCEMREKYELRQALAQAERGQE